MPFPRGMIGFGATAAGRAGGAGGVTATGAGGVVAGGAAASAARSAVGAGAAPGSAATGGTGAVVGGSAARGEVVGGTSKNSSAPDREAAVSNDPDGRDGWPKPAATPTVSTASDRTRPWRRLGRPEGVRRGMNRLLSG